MAVSNLNGGKMKKKFLVLAALLMAVFLIGCTGTANGGATYSQYNPQQGQQNQYVGGGCGVAPNADYDAPADSLPVASL